MMKRLAFLITLAFLFSTFGAAAQGPETLSAEQVVAEYGSVIQDEGLSIIVIHLNNQSVASLYGTAPNMQALRTQARQMTMFLVQGTNQRSGTFQPNPYWQIHQGTESIRARMVNISNFEANSRVPVGARFSGLVVTDQLIDPRTEFSVTNGEYQFDFSFSTSQIEIIEGS